MLSFPQDPPEESRQNCISALHEADTAAHTFYYNRGYTTLSSIFHIVQCFLLLFRAFFAQNDGLCRAAPEISAVNRKMHTDIPPVCTAKEDY